MSVKSLRGILLSVLAVTMLMVLSSSVWAASTIIDPDNKNSGKSGGDYELERDLGNGINLTLLGMIKDESHIGAIFNITSDEDATVSVNGNDIVLYDFEGRQFFRSSYTSLTPWIGNIQTNQREIIGGVPTRITFWFDASRDYKFADKFPKMIVNIQGQELTFRDVPKYQQQ
jgi:hypothetical protein